MRDNPFFKKGFSTLKYLLFKPMWLKLREFVKKYFFLLDISLYIMLKLNDKIVGV